MLVQKGHLWSVVWTFVNLCNTWPTRGRFIIPLIYDHIGDSFECGFTTWVQYLPRWKQTLFLKSPEVRTCFPKTKTLILLFDCIVPMVASCFHHSYVLSIWVMTVVIFHLRILPSMSLGSRTFVELCGYMDKIKDDDQDSVVLQSHFGTGISAWVKLLKFNLGRN